MISEDLLNCGKDKQSRFSAANNRKINFRGCKAPPRCAGAFVCSNTFSYFYYEDFRTEKAKGFCNRIYGTKKHKTNKDLKKVFIMFEKKEKGEWV